MTDKKKAKPKKKPASKKPPPFRSPGKWQAKRDAEAMVMKIFGPEASNPLKDTLTAMKNAESLLASLSVQVKAAGVTRTQFESIIWEWMDTVFGPRQTEVASSMVGVHSPGWDGTYEHDKEAVPHVTERIPNQGGAP